ncbi:MAG: ATP-binding protein [Candidatus Manganitrophus sp.]|nr:MAG: ATP-binding protein [Candidatus Manganitrophus sp.]
MKNNGLGREKEGSEPTPPRKATEPADGFGLQAVLFVCLSVMAAFPVLMFGLTQSRQWKVVQLQQADREGMSVAQALAREIGQTIAMQLRGVEVLAGQVEVKETMEKERLQALVSTQRSRFGGLSFMYVADAEGRSIVADPPFTDGRANAGVDYSDRDYYKELLRTGKTVISQVQLGRRSGVPNIQIATPIWGPEQMLAGFAEGSVDLTEIQSLTEQIASSDPDLRLAVLDKEGRVIAHPNPALRREMRPLAHLPLYQPAIRSLGEIRVERDEEGVPVRATAVPISAQGLDWTVVVSRPQTVIEQHAAVAQRQTLITVTGAFSAALLLAGFLASWLARPIRRLARLTIAVGKGDFGMPSPEPDFWSPREVKALHAAVGEMVGQLRAYTEELENRVKARTTALKETNRELEAFVYTVSHDLKAPVVSLHGMASLLMEECGERLDENGRHYLKRILSNAGFMEELIGDLLELSRVGRREKRPERFESEPLVRAVLEQCDMMIRKRGVEVAVLTPLPAVVFDPTHLKQIFLNLIGNGIKFIGSRAAPRLEIGGREAGGWVEFYVKDNGIGIDPEYHERIFGIFQRLKEVEVEGCGVGLAIVKKILEMSGGKIWLESRKGEGATFFFRIPKESVNDHVS